MSRAVRNDPFTPPERLWRLTTWLMPRLAGRSYKLVLERVGSATMRTNYAILAALDEFGPVSQATLGRRLGIDRSDIVALLNDLERDGLAIRAPDDADRRRNMIKITPMGSSTLNELDDLVNAAQDDLLEPLTPAERQQLNELLRRLVEHDIAQQHHGENPAGLPSRPV